MVVPAQPPGSSRDTGRRPTKDANLARGSLADGRFELLSRLGAGAFGIVYAARDLESGAEVALKVLQNAAPGAVVRFKQEFRALVDVQHPNLVQLGELIEDRGTWFFTMELVDGEDFLGYVEPRLGPEQVVAQRAFDEERLRRALPQVAEALHALHRTGRVHRDVKPSNIRVTRDGRLVLLDFGLVSELYEPSLGDDRVVGTAAYMAPEQASSGAVGPEADWYAMGAMLYEALTGQLPFDGSSLKVLLDKQRVDPPRPRDLVAGIPDDLDGLCMSLLARDPARRPAGIMVLGVLRGSTARTHVSPPALPCETLVGRSEELAALDRALARVRDGHSTHVGIHGPSGVGKSALLLAWLDKLRREAPHALVLRGRCYEQESVPYKALDGVVDALSRALVGMPPSVRAQVLPPDPGSLRVLFPTLGAVQEVAAAPTRRSSVPEHVQRARAIDALSELLANVSTRVLTIVAIDDLQWADPESVPILQKLHARCAGTQLLWVSTVRDEPSASADAPGADAWVADGTEQLRLTLTPLSEHDAIELATQLLVAKGDDAPRARAVALARESGGLPLFVAALLELGSPALDFSDALRERVRTLPEDARRLLGIVSLAGAPLPQRVAAAASGVAPVEVPRAIASLRTARLVRTSRSAGGALIECFHDRIRESAAKLVEGAARGELHRRLAAEWSRDPHGDPERLGLYWLEAGDAARARASLLRAAQRAHEQLAFERAAGLYARVLALAPGADEVAGIEAARAHSLRSAGALAAAGDAYLDAARHSADADQLELTRVGLECVLQSGQIDRGLELASALLARVGASMASTPRRAVVSLLWNRTRLALRGLSLREGTRSAGHVVETERFRADLLWSVGNSLSFVDLVHSAELLSEHLRLVLDLGDPSRAARALALESAHRAVQDRPPCAKARELTRHARELAGSDPDTQLEGIIETSEAVLAFSEMRLRDMQRAASRAAAAFARHRTELVWELNNARYMECVALAYLGDFEGLRERARSHLERTRERGDRYGETNIVLSIGYFIDLLDDDADRAAASIDALLAAWSQRGFHYQHFAALISLATIDLYRGGARAHERLERRWRGLEGSVLLRARNIAMFMLHVRGRAAVSAALARPHERAALLGRARADARRLERLDTDASKALAGTIRAACAWATGDRRAAQQLLEAALIRLRELEFGMHVPALEHCLGTLQGGDAGHARRCAAEARLAGMGVRNVPRYVGMIVPGFPA